MLPTWATVTLALGGPLVGGAIAFVTTIYQARAARRERQREERQAWLQRGLSVLAPLLTVLMDAEPRQLVAGYGAHTKGMMEGIWARWLDRRDDTVELAGAHPLTLVASSVSKFADSLQEALTSVAYVVKLLDAEADPMSPVVQGALDHAAAKHGAAFSGWAQAIGAIKGHAMGLTLKANGDVEPSEAPAAPEAPNSESV